MHILAVDVGTSSVKAAVLDISDGEPVGEIVDAEYELNHPSPDAAIVLPDRLWNAVTEAVKRATRQADDIEGVGLSGLMPALVLLGRDDQPLGPIWVHLDRRARSRAIEVEEKYGDEFLQEIGNAPLPGGISALFYSRWLEDEPDLPSRVGSYLHLNGWLAFRMTGVKAFDPSNASYTGIWGTVTDQQWSDKWCQRFDIDRTWLPEVKPGTTTLGALRSEVAHIWGLKTGIPVKLGIGDISSSLMACDATEDDLLHSVGTTQVLARMVNSPQPRADRLTRHLGIGNEFVYVTHNPVGGVALDWIKDLCFADQEEDRFFDETIPQAMDLSTEVKLDPPFLGGDRLNIKDRPASFDNLSLSTNRMHLLAAVLNAMRDGHRHALAAINWESDTPKRIFLTGGGAETVKQLLPEYDHDNVIMIERGSIRGIAKLFTQES